MSFTSRVCTGTVLRDAMLPTGMAEDLDRLELYADRDCLRLSSLAFDSELTILAAIRRWTACVTHRPYALDPEFVDRFG